MVDDDASFSTWFTAQYGKRPGGTTPSWKVLEELQQAQYECSRLEALYREQEFYDERRTAALYAWNACT